MTTADALIHVFMPVSPSLLALPWLRCLQRTLCIPAVVTHESHFSSAIDMCNRHTRRVRSAWRAGGVGDDQLGEDAIVIRGPQRGAVGKPVRSVENHPARRDVSVDFPAGHQKDVVN